MGDEALTVGGSREGTMESRGEVVARSRREEVDDGEDG